MHIKLLMPALVAAVTLLACQSAPQADQAKVLDAQTANNIDGEIAAVDTTASTITWVGTKPVGRHEGTFQLKDGSLLVQEDKLQGGQFTIDITSLKNTDLDGDMKKKLEGHLLSEDFFHASAYPTAQFTITEVRPFNGSDDKALLPGATHVISGNLKLKDSTRGISFPAVVQAEGNRVKAKANFNIDRSQWGMSYGNDKSLQDNFIRPEVNIRLHIEAAK